MLQVVGITFHLYGLILGISIVVAWQLVVLKAQQKKIIISELERVAIVAIVSGLVGARLYHVVSDWPLYAGRWQEAWQIWRGGLSVVGAVSGGVVGVLLMRRIAVYRGVAPTLSLATILDLSAFGIPFGQAIGRWGNYVNQELYGTPTSLPWAISIERPYRLPGYELVERYHPLFLYESVAMVVFGVSLWWWERRSKIAIGSGRYFALYMWWYSLVRFCLDFLRVDKREGWWGLGVNQWVLLAIWFSVTMWLVVHRRRSVAHAS